MLPRVIVAAAALILASCVPTPAAPESVPPMATVAPTGIACGVEDFGFGSGYDAAARECLWQAYQRHGAATFTTTHRTHEGATLVYRASVAGSVVEVVFESRTGDANAGMFSYRCSSLARRAVNDVPSRTTFAATGCSGRGPEVLF